MKKTVLFLVLMMYCDVFIRLSAIDKIVAYLSHAPAQAITSVANELSPTNSTSLQSAMKPELSGFPALYGGYLDYSDNDGKIEFPLRHKTPKIILVVTPTINPVPIKGETIGYLSVNPAKETQSNKTEAGTKKAQDAKPSVELYVEKASRNETKIYVMEKKQDEKKQWFWKVAEEKIPENGKINPIALVILTRASNVYIPLGDFMAAEETHMRAPAIHLLKADNKDRDVLTFFDKSRYFEQIGLESKKDEDKKLDQYIINND